MREPIIRNMSPHVFIQGINNSPLGTIWLAATELGVIMLEFEIDQSGFIIKLDKKGFKQISSTPNNLSAYLQSILDYLNWKIKSIQLPIDWAYLQPFQKSVLQETCRIPSGCVQTYKDIARAIGKPKAARAVGQAEARNPIPLIIPCHRVIGSDGQLHGYGGPGGIPTKSWLLRNEGWKTT